MRASEIMVSPVKTIGPEATIEEAVEMLLSIACVRGAGGGRATDG